MAVARTATWSTPTLAPPTTSTVPVGNSEGTDRVSGPQMKMIRPWRSTHSPTVQMIRITGGWPTRRRNSDTSRAAPSMGAMTRTTSRADSHPGHPHWTASCQWMNVVNTASAP
jgi:hypothetical protein